MRKFLSLIILFVISLTFIGCSEPEIDNDQTGNNDDEVVEDMVDKIEIYALNDFHGAIFADGDEVGISKLGNFLINEKATKPNSTFIISAGDMFQGTAVSSMTRGDIVVDIMNEIGFDAMTVGNHEFDWGIDGITKFIDGNQENNEAKFPFLGANIYQKSTNQLAEWTTPYTVIERGGLRVGIIGSIGEAQIGDILASVVEDYEFRNQLEAIKEYTKILRTQENADIVIVSAHDDTDRINNQLISLTGEYKVDAVINGHTHRYYASETSRFYSGDETGAPLPIVQSGNNGKYLGKIILEIDTETKEVVDASSEFIVAKNTFKTENQQINGIINNYTDEITASNEVLGTAGEYIERNGAAIWAANTVRKYNNSDVGVVNIGGIRGAAFPIENGSTVTFGNIFKIMPFENTIVTVELTGSQIKYIASNTSDLRFSDSINLNSNTINGESIDNSKLYTVATIDFAFERYRNLFNGENINYSGFLFRDQLVNDVKESVATNGKWYLN